MHLLLINLILLPVLLCCAGEVKTYGSSCDEQKIKHMEILSRIHSDHAFRGGSERGKEALGPRHMKYLLKNFAIEKYGGTSIQIHWIGTYHHEMVFKGPVTLKNGKTELWTVFISWVGGNGDSFFEMDFVKGDNPTDYENMSGRELEFENGKTDIYPFEEPKWKTPQFEGKVTLAWLFEPFMEVKTDYAFMLQKGENCQSIRKALFKILKSENMKKAKSRKKEFTKHLANHKKGGFLNGCLQAVKGVGRFFKAIHTNLWGGRKLKRKYKVGDRPAWFKRMWKTSWQKKKWLKAEAKYQTWKKKRSEKLKKENGKPKTSHQTNPVLHKMLLGAKSFVAAKGAAAAKHEE